jgi:hypothetical protein
MVVWIEDPSRADFSCGQSAVLDELAYSLWAYPEAVCDLANGQSFHLPKVLCRGNKYVKVFSHCYWPRLGPNEPDAEANPLDTSSTAGRIVAERGTG